MVIRLTNLKSDNRRTNDHRNGGPMYAVVTGLAVLLSLCVLACSSGTNPEQTQAPASQKDAADRPAASWDEDLGPLFKTPWSRLPQIRFCTPQGFWISVCRARAEARPHMIVRRRRTITSNGILCRSPWLLESRG